MSPHDLDLTMVGQRLRLDPCHVHVSRITVNPDLAAVRRANQLRVGGKRADRMLRKFSWELGQ